MPRSHFMTKPDLVREVAKMAKVTMEIAERIMEETFLSIRSAMERGDTVQIKGFVTFETRKRSKRMVRNPKTLEGVVLPARRIPYAKFSKLTKKIIAELPAEEQKENGAVA